MLDFENDEIKINNGIEQKIFKCEKKIKKSNLLPLASTIEDFEMVTEYVTPWTNKCQSEKMENMNLIDFCVDNELDDTSFNFILDLSDSENE